MYCLRISPAATNQGVISVVGSRGDGQNACPPDGVHARLSNMQDPSFNPSQHESRGILSKPLHQSLCASLFLLLIAFSVILNGIEAALTRLKMDVSQKRVGLPITFDLSI
jgi:hypothetical protein